MRLLGALPAAAECRKQDYEVLQRFLPRILDLQQERERQHLDEGQSFDGFVGEDEEFLRSELLLDCAEEILHLPALFVPEEHDPCLGCITNVDIRDEYDWIFETFRKEQHEEERYLRMIGQTDFLESDAGRADLLELPVLPLLF